MFKNAEVIVRFQEAGVYGPRIFIPEDSPFELREKLGELSIWKGADKREEYNDKLYFGFEFENNNAVVAALQILFHHD